MIHFGDLPIDSCAGQNKPYKTPLFYSQIHCIAPVRLQTSDGFFCFINHLSGGGVNANRNAMCSPSLACKNKTEKDCNCSRIAKETAMTSVIFVEGRRQTLFYFRNWRQEYERSKRALKNTCLLLPETRQSQATNLKGLVTWHDLAVDLGCKM